LRFTLTAGQRHDITQAPALIAGNPACEYVIADAAYDSDAFRAEIIAEGAEAVIRPRKSRVEDRPYDEEVYKLRNVIERFFHRLKQYRRVATRYDKYAVRYLGFVYVAAILITAKKM
jgi:transposase